MQSDCSAVEVVTRNRANKHSGIARLGHTGTCTLANRGCAPPVLVHNQIVGADNIVLLFLLLFSLGVACISLALATTDMSEQFSLGVVSLSLMLAMTDTVGGDVSPGIALISLTTDAAGLTGRFEQSVSWDTAKQSK